MKTAKRAVVLIACVLLRIELRKIDAVRLDKLPCYGFNRLHPKIVIELFIIRSIAVKARSCIDARGVRFTVKACVPSSEQSSTTMISLVVSSAFRTGPTIFSMVSLHGNRG